jgi:hypothetical protein
VIGDEIAFHFWFLFRHAAQDSIEARESQENAEAAYSTRHFSAVPSRSAQTSQSSKNILEFHKNHGDDRY